MTLIADLVLQTSNSPGTGTFSLIAPVSGRVSFVNGNGAGQAYYVAHDGTNWEKGVGTVTAGSPDTLSRDTVIRNSLGTTAKVNFSSMVTLISDVPAERALHAVADNGSVAMSSRVITGLAAGFAADHSVRYDQVEAKVATYTATSSGIFVPLPAGELIVEIELFALVPSVASSAYMRVSTNGGSSFLSGATEYNYSGISANIGGAVVPYGTQSYVPLTAVDQSTGFPLHGRITVEPSVHVWRAEIRGLASNSAYGQTHDFPSGYWSTQATATHVFIGFVNQSTANGLARVTKRSL